MSQYQSAVIVGSLRKASFNRQLAHALIHSAPIVSGLSGAAERQALASRIFTAAERAYCDAQKRPELHYAARFAAKEAVAK